MYIHMPSGSLRLSPSPQRPRGDDPSGERALEAATVPSRVFSSSKKRGWWQ
jgi:hypothetical protein